MDIFLYDFIGFIIGAGTPFLFSWFTFWYFGIGAQIFIYVFIIQISIRFIWFGKFAVGLHRSFPEQEILCLVNIKYLNLSLNDTDAIRFDTGAGVALPTQGINRALPLFNFLGDIVILIIPILLNIFLSANANYLIVVSVVSWINFMINIVQEFWRFTGLWVRTHVFTNTLAIAESGIEETIEWNILIFFQIIVLDQCTFGLGTLSTIFVALCFFIFWCVLGHWRF